MAPGHPAPHVSSATIALHKRNERQLEIEAPRDFHWFRVHVDLVVEMERWQDWSQVRSCTCRVFRCVTTEDDKTPVVPDLADECEAYAECFKGSLAFSDLTLYLRPKDKHLVEMRRTPAGNCEIRSVRRRPVHL